MIAIQRITIITNIGTNTVQIGDRINNLIVNKIMADHQLRQDGIDFVYKALDVNNEVVREIINCPVEIDYYEV